MPITITKKSPATTVPKNSNSHDIFALQCLSGKEFQIQERLQEIFNQPAFHGIVSGVYIPKETIQKHGKKPQKKPIFPGYIYLKATITPAVERVINEGVKSKDGRTLYLKFLRTTGRIHPVTPSEAKIIENEIFNSPVRLAAPNNLSVNDHVRITDGPFEDYDGIISEMELEKGKASVKIRVFNRDMPVEVELNSLKKV